MEIIVSEHSGFCFGVNNAVNSAYESNLKPNSRVYTLGELVHNDIVIEDLKSKGIKNLSLKDLEKETFDLNKDNYIIIRAHGIPLKEKEILEKFTENKNIKIIDGTCPFVKKIHEILDENTSADSTFTIVFGKSEHPETIGIISHIKGDYLIIRTPDELKNETVLGILEAHKSKKIVMVSQTTQNKSEYEKCQVFIKKLYTKILIFDTICNVTGLRQSEVEDLSKKCSLVLICGTKASANSTELYNISKRYCDRTYLIKDKSEIPLNLVLDSDTVGIAAGASVPGYIIKEVINTMSENEIFQQLLDESFKTLNTGDKVTGTVTSVANNEVHVDIGGKTTGILTLSNATDDPQAKLEDLFKVGDTVEAIAVRVNDIEGIATLSTRKTNKEKNWKLIVDAKENDAVIEGKVTEVVKGGVVVSALAQRIFVPASQTGLSKDADLSTLVGTVQKLKLIEVSEERHRCVGSIRVIKREEAKAAKEAFWSTIEVGKHYTGTVRSLTAFGAFVDLGGVDGMVHKSELSWSRIANPKDVVSVGQQIDVFVLSFDAETGRISLGYKTEDTNPWKIFTDKYSVDDVASVTIVSMTPFGAFAQIVPGVDGLIHISQIANKKLAHPSEVLSKGQVVDAKIIEINEETHNVALSVRALLAEEVVEEASEVSTEEVEG